MNRTPVRPFRSRDWFAAPGRPDMAALYLERFMNYGLTPEELRCGKPIIGIAQSGSDLTPCNRIHVELVHRIKAGIRDGGGIPMEFPTHPIFENCRRPTAALDRNLAYLGLVEILHGLVAEARSSLSSLESSRKGPPIGQENQSSSCTFSQSFL